MAKGKSTWKYNKLLTARNNYYAAGTPSLETIGTGPAYSYTSPSIPSAEALGMNSKPSAWQMGLAKVGNFMNEAFRSDGMKAFNAGIGGGSNGSAFQALRASGQGAQANPYAMAADMTGQFVSMIEDATRKRVPTLEESIGLAYGGRVNRFAAGGNVQGALNIASTAGALVGNAFEQANQAQDVSNILKGVQNKQMSNAPTVDSFDAIASDAANTSRLGHTNYKEILGGGNGINIGNMISSGAQGAGAGAMFGPIGAGIGAVIGVGSSLIGGLVARNRAKNRARQVNQQVDYTNLFNERSIAERAANVEEDMLNTMDREWYAMGGPINIKPSKRGTFTAAAKRHNMGVQEFASRVLANKENYSPAMVKKANFARNASKWKHAFGGDLMTHGANFDSGFTYIGNGGTHEENPFEGVQIGVDQEGIPNLVEEGEVIFNDYVFSNRLKVPKTVRNKYKLRGKKPLTFADAAKKLSKESEERPNDPISKRGLEALMNELMSVQEGLKASQEGNQFAFGGNIYKDGTGNIRRKNTSKDVSMGAAWASTVGAALKEKLKKISSLKGNERETAIDALINDTKAIQDSYYSNVYNKNTWGNANYVVGGEEHQDLFNTQGWNDVANFANLFDYRGASSDVAEKWKDNKIGDQTLLRMLGDMRHLSAKDLEEIRGYASQLGLNWNPYDDKNTLMYFSRANAAPTNTPNPFDKEVSTELDRPDEPGISSSKVVEPREPLDVEKLPTWMRYAPIVGSGIGVLTDALGITNRPDYSNADLILGAAREGYPRVGWNPIGNYLKYTPFDIDYTTNKMNAEAGATRRALLQNAGLNRGAAAAQLLAADNNYLSQIGDLGVKALQYNQGLKQQVEDFNRTTNITNSQGLLQADMANQNAYAQATQRRLQGTMAAAQMREGIKQLTDSNRADNISGFLTDIGSLGRENDAKNWRNAMYLSGVFGGKITPEAAYLMRMGQKPTKTAAKGGKIKRNHKRGLTF